MDTVSVGDVARGIAHLTLAVDGTLVRPLVVVDLDGAGASDLKRARRELSSPHAVLIGRSTSPLTPEAESFARTLTFTLAPGGPGRSWTALDPDSVLDAVADGVQNAPLAAFAIANLLRVTERAGIVDGLVAESATYSMLLNGPEFARWRSDHPVRERKPEEGDAVALHRRDDTLSVHLNRPERRNAFGAAMRDGLVAALEVAEFDPGIHRVELTGEGPSFCSGGDLDEFGTAADSTRAHVIRLAQSAGLAVHRLRTRVHPLLHGSCIGAGIEVPAFAARVSARDGTVFRLPELSMGLLPGAGGTVSITRRVGRHRAAVLALTGMSISVETALSWGLVDDRV